jgi:hypothetical protein
MSDYDQKKFEGFLDRKNKISYWKKNSFFQYPKSLGTNISNKFRYAVSKKVISPISIGDNYEKAFI